MAEFLMIEQLQNEGLGMALKSARPARSNGF
jgi:hypothetical protein